MAERQQRLGSVRRFKRLAAELMNEAAYAEGIGMAQWVGARLSDGEGSFASTKRLVRITQEPFEPGKIA